MRPLASTVSLVGLAVSALAVSALSAPPSPAASPSLVGVMVGGRGLTVQERVHLARELGARSYRPAAVSVEGWSGGCTECAEAEAAGLALVLTVRNDFAAGRPGGPPADLNRYEQRLGGILDATRPELLVVENEEDSRLFYTGTPEAYGAELAAACEIAHARHVPCTNGGLVSRLVALLVHDHYVRAGQQAKAADFARRAILADVGVRLPGAAGPRETDLDALLSRPRVREQLDAGRRLLEIYRSVPVDYVNFHWYGPNPAALREAVLFLREATGREPVTNEIGQHDDDPATTRAVLSTALSLRLPHVVWFSMDAPQARGLTEPDGRLRATGEAFRELARGRRDRSSLRLPRAACAAP